MKVVEQTKVYSQARYIRKPFEPLETIMKDRTVI
jgi:hypothetical protein